MTWLLFLCVLLPSVALAHDGPLDAYGCHSNKTRFGNTTSRECHTGLLTGTTYTSTSSEYQAYITAQAAVLTTLKADLAAIKLDVAAIKAKVLVTVLGSATITWMPNTEPDLAGYRVYYGTQSKVYMNQLTVAKSLLSTTVPNLQSGTYYFVVTAYDTAGNESGFSQEVSKVIP